MYILHTSVGKQEILMVIGHKNIHVHVCKHGLPTEAESAQGADEREEYTYRQESEREQVGIETDQQAKHHQLQHNTYMYFHHSYVYCT